PGHPDRTGGHLADGAGHPEHGFPVLVPDQPRELVATRFLPPCRQGARRNPGDAAVLLHAGLPALRDLFHRRQCRRQAGGPLRRRGLDRARTAVSQPWAAIAAEYDAGIVGARGIPLPHGGIGFILSIPCPALAASPTPHENARRPAARPVVRCRLVGTAARRPCRRGGFFRRRPHRVRNHRRHGEIGVARFTLEDVCTGRVVDG